jgi:hypothetical protein
MVPWAAPGGQGTFYAGVIDAAQAILAANSRPNTKNDMIILSDGDATASAAQMKGSATSYSVPSGDHVGQQGQGGGNHDIRGRLWRDIFGVHYRQSRYHPMRTDATNRLLRSNLNQIFQAIGGSLTTARLVPNNTK